MGDGGVGDPGGPNDYGGAEFGGTGPDPDPGFSGRSDPDVGPDTIGPTGGGPDDIPVGPIVPRSEPTPKPEKVEEKEEGLKRKARKRSLLNDEEKIVYRRSILPPPVGTGLRFMSPPQTGFLAVMRAPRVRSPASRSPVKAWTWTAIIAVRAGCLPPTCRHPRKSARLPGNVPLPGRGR